MKRQRAFGEAVQVLSRASHVFFKSHKCGTPLELQHSYAFVEMFPPATWRAPVQI